VDNLLPVVLPICCGIDVHKKTLTACLLQTGASGEAVEQVRTFRTVTAQLQELAHWLRQAGCRHVALESTGVYWKPVFNVLEPAGLEVVLVNAQHVKNVPGRKTDVKDAQWLATLLRVGLLRASFVPPKEIRALRDLTRYRTQVIRQRAQECNRIQKLLEDCNIKLAGVATDILGASGRDMLRALGDMPRALFSAVGQRSQCDCRQCVQPERTPEQSVQALCHFLAWITRLTADGFVGGSAGKQTGSSGATPPVDVAGGSPAGERVRS
jgi:transposase